MFFMALWLWFLTVADVSLTTNAISSAKCLVCSWSDAHSTTIWSCAGWDIKPYFFVLYQMSAVFFQSFEYFQMFFYSDVLRLVNITVTVIIYTLLSKQIVLMLSNLFFKYVHSCCGGCLIFLFIWLPFTLQFGLWSKLNGGCEGCSCRGKMY